MKADKPATRFAARSQAKGNPAQTRTRLIKEDRHIFKRHNLSFKAKKNGAQSTWAIRGFVEQDELASLITPR